MGNYCFVIMPFGGRFDEIYHQIYQPAIRNAGLEPRRADDIYDNQPLLQDIRQSIQDAALILAEVTGRNPNVNYELGMAHCLGKEVIIVTSNSEDVPSDYRHLRYLYYDREEIGWNETLSNHLVRTFHTVLDRLHATEHRELPDYTTENIPSPDDFDEPDPRDLIIERAQKLGYKYFDEPSMPPQATLCYHGNYITLDSREGTIGEWKRSVTCLLAEKVLRLSDQLPFAHSLRMRDILFDRYASHSFSVAYIYQNAFPKYTAHEMAQELQTEFDGEIFVPQIEYIKDNSYYDQFHPLSGDSAVTGNAVCFRDGFYVADITKTVSAKNGTHHFYRLDGLLPLTEINADSYVPGETHWLADWNQEASRFQPGDTVRFQVTKVDRPRNWGHVAHARNVNFRM